MKSHKKDIEHDVDDEMDEESEEFDSLNSKQKSEPLPIPVKKQKGGKRNGAGRKKKDEKWKDAKVLVDKVINDNIEELVGAQMDAAKGLKKIGIVEYKGKNGAVVRKKEYVYVKEPDLGVGQYLLNRLLGKPIERTEFDTSEKIDNMFDKLAKILK